VPRTPLSPTGNGNPKKERFYSRQLDWLAAEQGGAPK